MSRVILHIARRSIQVLSESAAFVLEGEIRKAVGLTGRFLFDYHRTILFSAPSLAAEDAGDAPADLTVRSFAPEIVGASLDQIGELCEPRVAMSFAGQGATAYVAFLSDAPVGVGWKFAVSRPLLRLHPDGVMLGGFFVKESVRGRGIYGHLLRIMSRDVSGAGRRAFAETARRNEISQQGLTNAGFRCEGELSFVVVLGVLGPVRLRRRRGKRGLVTDPGE